MMIDLVIVVILVTVTVVGAKVGLVRTMYQVLGSLFAWIFAFMIYPIVQGILSKTPLYEGVKTWIADKLPSWEGLMGLQEQAAFIKEATTWLPDFIGEHLVYNNNSEVYSRMGVKGLEDYIVVYLADFCMMILALLISWLSVKIALLFVLKTLDIVSKLPVIRTVNKVGGCGLGFLKGVFMIWLIQAIVPILILIPAFEGLEAVMGQGLLNQLLYENNIILQLINSVVFK